MTTSPSLTLTALLVVVAATTGFAHARLVPSGWWPSSPRFYSDPFYHPFHYGLSPFNYPYTHMRDPFSHPFRSLSSFFDPFGFEPSVFSKLSTDLNKMREQVQAEREGRGRGRGADEHEQEQGKGGSFCEYYIEKSPRYSVKVSDENVLTLTVDLPHVAKEDIQLVYDNEKRSLSLSAPFEVYQGFHNDDDAREDTRVPVEHKEAIEPAKAEEEKGGLVIVDEEEEEEKRKQQQQQQHQEIKEGDSQSVSVKKEASAIRCKVSGAFKGAYSLPKATDMSKISAKFENEKLAITLPLIQDATTTRSIQIE